MLPKKGFTAKVLPSSGQMMPQPQPVASLSGRKITKLTQQQADEWKGSTVDYRPPSGSELPPLPEPFDAKAQPEPMLDKPIDPDAEFEMTTRDYHPRKKPKGR
jgi:hypothetical protein